MQLKLIGLVVAGVIALGSLIPAAFADAVLDQPHGENHKNR